MWVSFIEYRPEAEVYSLYFWVEVCSWEPGTLGLNHTAFNELYFTTLFKTNY